jgi:hypothetical protein
MIRPITTATRGMITNRGIHPIAIATRGFIVIPAQVVALQTRPAGDEGRRMSRKRKDDDEVLMLVCSLFIKTRGYS